MDRFTIRRTLGSGGMGVVYEAHDHDRNELVALKVLRDLDPAGLYRFKREFRALTDITHPNLITLYEFVSAGDQCFFTMELVDGVTLLEYVRPGFYHDPSDTEPRIASAVETAVLGLSDDTLETRTMSVSARKTGYRERLRAAPLDEANLTTAFRQLVEGVFALHQAGKLHRDLKPSNVLVGKDGRVVLCDFGLAIDLEGEQADVTREYEVVGTVGYMSPEQAGNMRLTEASDWYSVGVILHEALTGRLPFEGDPRTVMKEKQLHDPPPLSLLAPDAPAELAALCAELLRTRPDDRPSGRAILERVGLEPPPQFAQASSSIELRLVGREPHLAKLREAYAAARRGRASIVHVHGGSGMGKTALLRHFLDELQADDVVVLSGRCYDRESVPYKALDAVVDALSAFLSRLPRGDAQALLPADVLALARLFPVLRRVEAVVESPNRRLDAPDPQETRRRAFAATRELFDRLTRRYAVVVCIDDLQWGDADSATLLAELLRPPGAPPLLFIGGYRSEDAASSPLVQSLRRTQAAGRLDAEVREIEVGALAPDDARTLALSLLQSSGPAARAQVERIAQESRGSPFFVDELARHVETARGAGAPSLDGVLLDRIAAMPPAARALLTTVAVAGRPMTHQVVGYAADVGDDERSAMARLRAERLVRARGIRPDDPVEVFHDRIREALVGALAPDELRHYHQRLALALERARSPDLEALVDHWYGAGDHARAGAYAASAADQAFAALAFDHAARMYRLALELQALPGDEARALRVRLADSLANAGRGADAAAAYYEAAAGANAADALDCRRRAADELLRSGRVDEGMVALREVADAVGIALPNSPRRALFSLLAARARIRTRGLRFRTRDASEVSPAELRRIDVCAAVAADLGMVNNIFAATLQSRSLLFALRGGEPARLARAVAFEAVHSAASGRRARRRVAALQSVAEALVVQTGDQRAAGAVTASGSLLDYQCGQFRSALAKAEQAVATFRDECVDVTIELNTCRLFGLWSLYYLGDLRELAKRVPVLLAEAGDRGDRFLSANLCAGLPNVAWLITGNVAGSRAVREAVMKEWPSGYGYHLQHYWDLLARVQTELYAGDHEVAWRDFHDQWGPLWRSQLLRIPAVKFEALHMHARVALAQAVAGHEPARMRRLAERDARRLDRQKLPCSAALAELARAGAAAVAGRDDDALQRLARAEAGFRSADMPLYAAVAQRRRGQLAGGDDGRHAIATADAWMKGQAIAEPARFTAMLAPGFRD